MPPIIQSRHEHLTRVLSPFLSAAPALGSRPGHSAPFLPQVNNHRPEQKP